MKNSLLIALAVLIVAGAGGFYTGMKYQQSKTPAFFRQARNGSTTRNGFTPVNGTVIAGDANSITVQLPDGSSKIVLVTPSTQINKATAGNMADLINGIKVAVFGAGNSDGSVTATSIQINPPARPSGTPGNQPQ